jgi:hypothetical protein
MSLDQRNVDNEEVLSAVYERVKEDFAKLKPEDLVAVNLDIPDAVMTIVGALPEAKALRERFV